MNIFLGPFICTCYNLIAMLAAQFMDFDLIIVKICYEYKGYLYIFGRGRDLTKI